MDSASIKRTFIKCAGKDIGGRVQWQVRSKFSSWLG